MKVEERLEAALRNLRLVGRVLWGERSGVGSVVG